MKKIVWVLFAVLLAACNGMQMENKQTSPAVESTQKFVLLSENFKDGESIPSEFTCDGKNISPSLKWNGVPKGTKSFALTIKDPDAPNRTFVHWIVLNIPANINEIKKAGPLPEGAVELTNDFGDIGYGGPCPPSGTHRYVWTLYALNALELEANASNVDEVINRHIIAKAELTGLYKRGLR
jgi:Raf kinase inhibitor-like YbhB/YbcL family protein